MKKIVLFGCTFLFTGLSVFAQLPKFNLGIKAGMNLAKLQTNLATEDNRLGYQVGIWARLGAASLYVQPELYLGSKGGKFTAVVQENGNEVNASAKVDFTTLDLPVLVGSRIGIDKLNLRFMAGPVVSFILDKNKPVSAAYQNITDFGNYKDNAWGLQAGAGVDIASFSVDLRYEAGLSNISKSDKYDQKSNLWHLSLGLKIL